MEIRHVCFVRHAKSSWDDPRLSDFDRPLEKRGLKDAPLMASKMNQLSLAPDLIITSGAMRAKTTAEFFKKEFDLPDEQFIIDNDLYEATPDDVFDVLRSAPDSARFVYLFGHNPTFTWVANHISGVRIDNVPTCGVVHIQADLSHWKKFKPEHAAFVGFHYPKQYS